MTEYAISVNTMTDGHVAAQTWNVSEAFAQALTQELRDDLGEPDASQLIPIELADEFIADPRHVAVT